MSHATPNRIRVQDFHFRLPLEPRRSETVTRVPMGPIGMALNGVVFFNPFEAGGMNAIAGYSEVWLDSCCGHPQQTGVYHYHRFPSCLKTPFPDEGRGHLPVIGFAFDGYPLHGPYEEAGLMARDLDGERALDVCNGDSDPKRGYHYHVTPVLDSPAFREALERHTGVSDTRLVMVDIRSAGNYRSEEDRTRRLARLICFLRSDPTDNGYVRPIEGIRPVVDLNTMEVFRIEEHGHWELPPGAANYSADRVPNLRTDLQPLEIIQPEGPSFEVQGYQVHWQKWRFVIGFNAREGQHATGFRSRRHGQHRLPDRRGGRPGRRS